MRSGFVAVVGRTGVGKSSLVNAFVGTKVSITSKHPNTTRHPVQGVAHRPDAQAVFVDTPGFHRPRSRLGERLNDAAEHALAGVDVVVFVVDATAPIGPGDRRVAEMIGGGPPVLCVVNKIDRARKAQVVDQLAAAGEWDFDAYHAVSAHGGQGLDALADDVCARLPEGPAYFPSEMVSDTPEAQWVAELVREALLAQLRDELPHSLACKVTDWDGPYIRCDVIVERDSQKAIVIGHNASVIKRAGIAARRQLPEGTYLDLVVRVAKGWQGSDALIDRFGYAGVDEG